MSKPTLCLDFDGVVNSYSSGWQGATVMPDPPVPGALEFIVEAFGQFQVAIYSSRSSKWGGRRAMKRYVRDHLIALGVSDTCPPWWKERIWESAFADPWPDEVRYAADLVIDEIKWPLFKPPAMVTLDDRALTFTGTWPSIEALKSFKPWNKPRGR